MTRTLFSPRWVFDVKNDAEGKITRLKARLVAIQEKGFDYIETFSPTVDKTPSDYFYCTVYAISLKFINWMWRRRFYKLI